MVPPFLLSLLQYSPLYGIQLKPEQALSIAVGNLLRDLALTGKLRATFTKIPNEGKRSWRMGCLFKAMGMITGALDWVFVWEGGGGWIELKIGKRKESPTQEWFMAWCKLNNVNHAVCRSPEEVLECLQSWGALTA